MHSVCRISLDFPALPAVPLSPVHRASALWERATKGPPMIIKTQADVTTAVLAEVQRAEDPRTREILTSLVKHLHGFIRETRLSEAEFQQACAHHQPHRPEIERQPQRGGPDFRFARRLLARLPAQQRRQRLDRNDRQPARPVLAHAKARAPRTADRLLRSPTPGTPLFVEALRQGSRRTRRSPARRSTSGTATRRATTRTRTPRRPT